MYCLRLPRIRCEVRFGRVSHESLVGSTVAGFKLQSMIGEGGTSAVYRAEHPHHGTVALKVLKEKLRQDSTAVTRFVREAQYGSRVTHPNVVRTIEIGQSTQGLHFLAIEWASGDILDRYAKRNSPLPRADVADIVYQIAQAVQAAHDAGIVHRDLKPENVMYDSGTRQIKLLDFGIATETDSAPEQRLTRAGFFVGTLMYVAPEALSGALVGPFADQYSLSTIAYYLLTGCLPYVAKTPREMFTQLLSQPPINLNSAKTGIRFGPAVEHVVMRGLSKEPTSRYPDVHTFAGELRSALNLAEAPGDDGLISKMKKLFGK